MCKNTEDFVILGIESVVEKTNEMPYQNICFEIYNNPKDLIEDLAYNDIKLYFYVDNDDLVIDLLNDKEFVGFVDRYVELEDPNDLSSKLLLEMQEEFLSVINNPTYDGYEKLLVAFNKNIRLLGNKDAYKLFKNIDEAYQYVIDNYDNTVINNMETFKKQYNKII